MLWHILLHRGTQWRRISSLFLSQIPSSGHNAPWLHNFKSLQTSLMAFNYSLHSDNLPHCCQHFISKNVALRIFIHFSFSRPLPISYKMSLNLLAWYIRPLYDLGLIDFSSYILLHSPPSISSRTTHPSLKTSNIFNSVCFPTLLCIWKSQGLCLTSFIKLCEFVSQNKD